MCIVTLNLQDHPQYKLIVAANRDEFYQRPTARASFWSDHPSILGGRDLKEMGTWLGITKQGRIALVTNFRDLATENKDKKSRGGIVNRFLTSNEHPVALLKQLKQEKDQYNGFNLIAGTVDDLYHYGNNESNITKITAGTHSVSNGTFQDNWPKTTKARTLLQDYVKTHDRIKVEDIFNQLNDRELASDDALPNTGVAFELEQKLSSIFIENVPNYGTRVSTVLLVTKDNEVTFAERTYREGQYADEKVFHFTIESMS